MKEFSDKVAVVTGAASGIGRAVVERLAAEGMKVVLADIEELALAAAVHEMRDRGATVLGVATDVGQESSVTALAERAMSEFGAVHILMNNAGVGGPVGPMWKRTVADWRWVIDVNLWSVIHGIRTFTPIMLSQKTEGHIVNTASMAGLISNPFMGPYNATKHAVVALSETLYSELARIEAPIGVSVLCPGFVNTRIADSDRNRPKELYPDGPQKAPSNPDAVEHIRKMLANGMPPAQVADRVFEAIRDQKLYILTHPEHKDVLRIHLEDVIEERNPDPEILRILTGPGK